MKKNFLMALLLIPLMSFGQNRVQTYIDQQMKTDSLLINAVVGILAVDQNGREVASWNPDMPLLTASTMKTITTGLGFAVLGPDYRFSTRVAYDGRIENGILHGNLYIVGGADPTLGSRDTIAFPIDTVFAAWADAVQKAGIRRINGRIVGDDRIFDEESIPSSWSYGNIGYDYGSGTSGLSFCENLTYFEIEAGEEVGDPTRITPIGPYSPYMTYINESVTGPKGDGDNTEYYASRITPVGKFVGTYGIDAKPRTLVQSNKYGPATCASEFAAFLKKRGVGCKGITDVRQMEYDGAVPAQKDLVYIAETFSPELRRIVKVTNTISNNFFAETIFKMVGKTLVERKTGEPCMNISYSAARKAVKEYLKEQGVSTYGYTQDDGSGLSRQNYVSPRFFTRFYAWMKKDPSFKEYLSTFPGPGRPGTLQGVLRKADPDLKKTIYAKSGSLSSVRCYAGYVDSKRGLIRFAILVNNYDCPTSKVQPKIEGFLEELAKYGAKQ
ncbi:MAG: D-alanyl-D-alanine carboxypeptidase/D-alanyl-D-alanine-endopeptidase [Bacteroidales bacterium]|nr:D-alanyl-D-alanine carboxypeptidase/D-alanyl-D-alanine-endopeptidase [Bacteroidales bacterium]